MRGPRLGEDLSPSARRTRDSLSPSGRRGRDEARLRLPPARRVLLRKRGPFGTKGEARGLAFLFPLSAAKEDERSEAFWSESRQSLGRGLELLRAEGAGLERGDGMEIWKRKSFFG